VNTLKTAWLKTGAKNLFPFGRLSSKPVRNGRGALHSMDIHWDILDDNRKEIAPLFKGFSEQGFYLAGGTGLALQLGHRDSIDFDFFIRDDFDTQILTERINQTFHNQHVLITQIEKNTLSCLLNNKIQLSFLGYKYPVLEPFVETEYFNIASVEDIACMKLSAITSRSLEKDYIDLYFILQNNSLKEMLEQCRKKFPALDPGLILKSISYFDDITREPIMFKKGREVAFEKVRMFLEKTVSVYFSKHKS
jgi:hypothetical protein